MTTFTVTKPDGEKVSGLTAAEVGNVLMRGWAGEWRVARQEDGAWRLEARSLQWYPTPVVVSADNEEQANQKACEEIASHADWQIGFQIEPDAAPQTEAGA